jgi:NADH-quinone oxidoreductase subunit L
MTLPLGILAVAAATGGWFGAPVHFGHAEEGHGTAKVAMMVISVAAAVLGGWLGYQRYSRSVGEEPVRDALPLDRVYGSVFVSGLRGASRGAAKYLEEGLVQGLMKAVSGVVDVSGNMIRMLQTGSAQTYLMMIMIVLVGALIWWMGGEGGYGKF